MEIEPSQNDLDSGPRKSCMADFLRRTRKKNIPKERERYMAGRRKVKRFDSMLVGGEEDGDDALLSGGSTYRRIKR
jgi:hypothetical protein